MFELPLDSRISITSQEQEAGGKEETGRPEATCPLSGRGERQEDPAFVLREPVGDRVHEMLLGTSLKEHAAAWTASFKKCKHTSQTTDKNHQKKLDAGLRNQLILQDFF